MKMEDTKPHVLMIPYPAQGHINPSFSFAESLAAHGLRATFLTTTALSLSANICDSNSITIHHISDGFELVKEPETVEVYLKRMKDNLSHNLAEFIDGGSCWPRPRVIIYDSIMPWILDIAQERGLLGASFFTQSCGVCAVYYHLKQGLLRFPYDDEVTVSLPGLPVLGVDDLPSFPVPASVDILVNQFLNLERADWIFFNSFDKLESEVVDWMASRWAIKTVGPTHLLQKNEEYCNDKKRQGHGINMFEPKHEGCKTWLDSKKDGTVVYVSFGSIASLGKEQMEEVAYGLILSNCPFLWVVRSSEMDKLPQNLDYSQNGLIVEWCHQPQVLAHHSLACFMSHCGWNSTLEALSHGVPLVDMPHSYDQKTNSKFIVDVWGFGGRLRNDGENGIIGREEIAKRINQFVGGDGGVEIKKNACKWRDLAYEAVGKGGTSANHLQEFVSKLING